MQRKESILSMQVPPFAQGSDWQSSTSAVKGKSSENRWVADLIRVQINRTYSAEVMLFRTKKNKTVWASAATQALTQDELIISPALNTEMCPCC